MGDEQDSVPSLADRRRSFQRRPRRRDGEDRRLETEETSEKEQKPLIN